ncbi:phage protease [Algicola sagamiensis]|uniref:phage protease n=1 Tax=Algicola sagamiensis TaxID=163869 RepID=UPI00037EDA3D|nr:phage protease [Algicola sagamiensis]
MKENTLALNTELRTHDGNIPDWVELIPPGQHVVGRDARHWVNDSPYQLIQAFNHNGADLPIDIEHATEFKAPNGEPAPAVGWIKEIEVREMNAIWGRVEWNAQGKKLIKEKSYRYLSPVFLVDRETTRIKKLCSAGLTNQPNLHLTALNQRQSTGEKPMALALAIATVLGLSSDSTEEQAVYAINTLKTDKEKALNHAQNPSLEKFVPRADHDVALNRAKEAEQKIKDIEEKSLNQKIEQEIESALIAGVITPATADYHRANCQQEGGLGRFQAYVKAAPEIAGDSGLDGKKTPEHTSRLSEDDKEACQLLGLSEKEFKNLGEDK